MISFRCDQIRRVGSCAWLAVALLTTTLSLEASASRFLELETEIPVRGLGVGLDVAVGPDGRPYLSSESQGGIWRLAESGVSWLPLISGTPGRDVPRHPKSILADPQGHLWVSDGDRGRVAIMDAQGRVRHLFDDGRKLIRKPSELSRAGPDQVAVWSNETRSLTLLSTRPEVLPSSQSFADATLCIVEGQTIRICVAEDRKTLLAHQDGRLNGRWTLDGTYPRVGDLEPASDGSIYLTDTAGRRLYAVTADLGRVSRFRLYESLLQTPTRVAIAADRLWLIDEGRQSLLGFRIREAVSAWEHAILGEEYLALGLDQEALDELGHARALGLVHPDLDLQTGIVLYGLDRFEEALASWNGLSESHLMTGAIGLWRGNALFRLGRHREALDAYMSVTPHDSDYPRARFNLAQTHLALGQPEPARSALDDLVAHQPDHDLARLSLARALVDLGEHRQARSLLEGLIAKGPAAQLARYQLGHLFLVTGDIPSALPLLQQAAEQGPDFRAALTDLIEAHRNLENTQLVQFYQQRLNSLRSVAEALDPLILEDGR